MPWLLTFILVFMGIRALADIFGHFVWPGHTQLLIRAEERRQKEMLHE